jgi:hypothetical protein
LLGRIALRLLQEAERDAVAQRATDVDSALEEVSQDATA